MKDDYNGLANVTAWVAVVLIALTVGSCVANPWNPTSDDFRELDGRPSQQDTEHR